MIKAALTGVNGMIGRHMHALLKSRNYDVAQIDRSIWDFTNWKSISELDYMLDGVGVVFHFAAALPKANSSDGSFNNDQSRNIFDVNVRSCLNIAEWAQKRNIPIVFLSGATVYKNPHAKKIVENSPEVVQGLGGLYGYSKLLAEKVIAHYVSQGLDAIILRPSSVYGYGLGSDKLVNSCLVSAEKNSEIVLSEPNNHINLIHAADVSEAALIGYEKKAWGVYNIASDSAVSIRELAENAIIVANGGGLFIESESANSESFVRFDLDCTKAKDAFGFKQNIQISEGLKLMYTKKLLKC